jgi:hypothetical protein
MIIEELGLGELPQEKQEELLVKIGEVVMKRVYLNTMERLERADQDRLIDIMDKNPDQVETFLTAKIPDYEEFVKKIVEDFKREMKEDMGLKSSGS